MLLLLARIIASIQCDIEWNKVQFFSFGIFFLFFLTVIPKLLEIGRFLLEQLFLRFVPQLFKYTEIRALCWPLILKLNAFINKKHFYCKGCVERSTIIVKIFSIFLSLTTDQTVVKQYCCHCLGFYQVLTIFFYHGF